jgi:hypothetical protein
MTIPEPMFEIGDVVWYRLFYENVSYPDIVKLVIICQMFVKNKTNAAWEYECNEVWQQRYNENDLFNSKELAEAGLEEYENWD